MNHHALRFSALVAALALSLFTLSAPAFAATRNGDLLPRTICANDYDPHSGWVITDVSSTLFECGLPIAILYTIAPPPTTRTIICLPSVLPPTFLIVAEGTTPQQCGNVGASQTIIPTTEISTHPSLTVCGFSPIPTNWVTIAESRSNAAASTCSGELLFAVLHPNHPIERTIEPAPLDTLPHTVCADSPLPAGFTQLLSTVSTSACPLDGGISPVIMRTY